MSAKRLTEHLLESLSLKGVCTGSSEFIHVKRIHCWKSHAVAKNLMIVRSVKLAAILQQRKTVKLA